jgi:hypothetical protein
MVLLMCVTGLTISAFGFWWPSSRCAVKALLEELPPAAASGCHCSPRATGSTGATVAADSPEGGHTKPQPCDATLLTCGAGRCWRGGGARGRLVHVPAAPSAPSGRRGRTPGGLLLRRGHLRSGLLLQPPTAARGCLIVLVASSHIPVLPPQP